MDVIQCIYLLRNNAYYMLQCYIIAMYIYGMATPPGGEFSTYYTISSGIIFLLIATCCLHCATVHTDSQTRTDSQHMAS